ncbi:hypothetical protein O181_006496 [Austropuccinia psidii MF-1]|uniref:Uncharacterized protein n=1 Tax=Austropuccinia psidii MF-1 TaxID=1389203 RepID=A0A9Q3GGT7_9BASI|nr:hypothetical protein [Austropuccinia psidii MF-1]
MTDIVQKGRFSNPPEASQGFKKIKMEKASPVLKTPQAYLKLSFLQNYAEAEQKRWAQEQRLKKEQLEQESELQHHKSKNQHQKAESQIKLKEKESRCQAIDNWMKNGGG